MASKLAVYDTGYDDERFEQIVSETLHCIICTNVIKDPVMCQRNEHLFCRACITTHLMYSQTCPTCMEPLTVETLRQARTVMNLLSELKIRCEFFDRGCGKFVQLGDLERHVADCGFAPAVCTNEGCQLEVNKQDLLHHETAVCELRRVKCHSCNEIRREMDTVKADLVVMNEKLDRNEKKLSEIETNQKSVELILKQFTQQQKNNQEAMKENLKEITKQLEKMIQQTSPKVWAEQEKSKSKKENYASGDTKKITKHGLYPATDLPSTLEESLAAGNTCNRNDIPIITHQSPEYDVDFSFQVPKNDVRGLNFPDPKDDVRGFNFPNSENDLRGINFTEPKNVFNNFY